MFRLYLLVARIKVFDPEMVANGFIVVLNFYYKLLQVIFISYCTVTGFRFIYTLLLFPRNKNVLKQGCR